jgi:hypothetical protein
MKIFMICLWLELGLLLLAMILSALYGRKP